ncbi:Uncharacterised protein [Listeria grayi]|uniref:Uncharacterized protein n=1 Tax=Listeria grayi FSL F6-1183 TaxID=1265827 RepID=A0A829R952_LISGR|nr:hypothetical protein [Listeria grayi]EUJ30332.1 hypothetical protein LMUR_00570 [Listeria grayi FSL F6-1183]VEI30946.1 Uncharacterised protein [Listeria grayi]
MIKKLMFIFAIGLIVTGVNYMPAQAKGNTGDTTFKLIVKPTKSADYDRTTFRPKYNRSSVYMKINYVQHQGRKLTGWVVGADSYKDCSGGYYYRLDRVRTIKLANYVLENGRDYAAIKAGADKGKPNRVQGVWSPDSKK